jgi:putative oxidoreductase
MSISAILNPAPGRVAAVLGFLPTLLTRLVVGHAFYQAGGGKIANLERTAEGFASIGIPWAEQNAVFIAYLEYLGGLLLVVGLLTRVTSFLLASTMVVAIATAHGAEFAEMVRGASEVGLTELQAFVLLLFLLWLFVFGPGPLSVDALIHRVLARRAPPAAKTA